MAQAPAEVGSTANRYQILGKLAVGGMAEIFLARGANTAGLVRYCVLKRILRERARDAEFARMFLDEARLAAQLQHPNIASVHDIGTLGDSYFFTMEYVHGETVRSLIQRSLGRNRPIPLACVLTIIAGAAAGLHHAHDRVSSDGRPLGIVHRDVSPSNLMVSYEGNLKIVDFGVAKADDRAVETLSGTVKGKISYLSPEQCRGARVDRRSDLFSLGIVMWEMLTGARLYRRPSDFDNMTAIVHEPPPAPSSRRADVPRAIDDIVLRLLAKLPADRFQTAGEVVEAIENASMRAGTILSTSAVSRLIHDLFGTRPEPWLALGDAAPPRTTLASRPLADDLAAAPLDAVELELAAVPDLSVSMVIDDPLEDGTAPGRRGPIAPGPRRPTAEPAPRAAAAAPVQLPVAAAAPAGSMRAILEAVASAVPATPVSASTLRGVSAPAVSAAVSAIRQRTAALASTQAQVSPGPPVNATPSGPFDALPSSRAASAAQPALERPPPRPDPTPPPGRDTQGPGHPGAASSIAITTVRASPRRAARIPILIAVVIVAAVVGVIGAWWLSEPGPPAGSSPDRGAPSELPPDRR